MKPIKTNFNSHESYKNWVAEIKAKISTTHVRMATTANAVLISFYWELGKDISTKIKDANWGSKVIDQLANDLKKELPGVKGFSRTNLYYMKQFYDVFSQPDYQKRFVPQSEGQLTDAKIPQLGGQIPWGHIKVLLNKTKDASETNLTEILPEDLKCSLPTVEEIEKELEK